MSNPNNNVLIVSLVALTIAVIGAIVALAIFGSPSNAVVTAATGQIITVVTLIAGILVTLKVTSEAKTAAVEAATIAKVAVVEGVKSKEASRENAQSIAALSEQTSHSLDGVNQKVDGHLGGLMEKIEALTKQVSRLEQEKAVTKVETEYAIAEAAAAPPPGSTPPHGTPSGDAGTTTIVIDPASAMTIQSTDPKPVKGPPSQPKAQVGDKQ